jgi:putative ABC transport system ATP-binding protein
MESTIKCRGIKKSYGQNENRIEALKGVNLDVYPGQLTLLVGPSGSGKSTLLSIITTLLTPDEGDLFLLDMDVHKMTANDKAAFCRNNLGIVFQSLFLIPTLTVAENVSLPLLVEGKSETEAMAKALEALKMVKIDHRAQASPSNLSKGQQQRVAIARAIVTESNIIVCDEPTSALDLHSGQDAMNLLHELAKKHNKTVLVVTHDHRVFPHADRIIYLNDGQIAEGDGK